MSLPFLVHPALDLALLTFLPLSSLSLPVTYWSGIRVSLPGCPLVAWTHPQSLDLDYFPLANLPSSLPALPQVEAET